jgi:thiamine transport system ATP-binding protein
LLIVDHLTVSFGGHQILSGVSVTVPTGAIVSLPGPSGSGKSTLLRSIAGLIPMDAGEVLWRDNTGQDNTGHDIALHHLPTFRRQIGLVFQDRVLFPHLDVAHNIGFGLKYTSLSRPAKRDRIEALLTLMGLDGLGKRAVSSLSGGQAQRVALARALAPQPRVLLLDEPLTALDPETKARLIVDVRTTLKQEAMTAVYVTHDPDEAEAVADRTLHIEALRH